MENNQDSKKRTAPVIWGVVLITVGIIWMLCAAGIIRLSIAGWIRYIVPFSMIVCGIILLVKNRLYKIICLSASIILFLLLLIFNGSCREHHRGDYKCDLLRFDRHELRNKGYHHHRLDVRAKFDVELKSDVVKVEVEAGAAELKAGKTTENYLDVYRDGELKESFAAAGEKEIYTKNGYHEGVELEMAFNTTSVYDMQFKLGAVGSELDLAPYKVRNVEVEIGASGVNLTLGDKVKNVEVKVESGAGSVTIRVPKSSGCSVLSEGFLIDKELPDFKKVNGVYKTDNFENAEQRVEIMFEGAVSNLKIERY